MQRLFSTFADGWPGVGILLLRLVVGITLIEHGIAGLSSNPSIQPAVLSALTIGTGLLLFAGLWTPVAGALLAAIEVWNIFLLPENLRTCILLGTIGASLAMVGPGAWSIDARLFGRKHLQIRES
ncbi:MAG: DoxX family protein [Terracidiphilus sp.]